MFVTTPALARMLGVPIDVVTEWFDLGELRGFRTPGGRRRVHRDDALAFILAKGFAVPPELSGDG